MKIHSNLAYLPVALLLLIYSYFFMDTYFTGKFHFLILTLFSIAISIILFLACKLVVRFELNFYIQIFFFLILAELLKISFFFSRGQSYNSEDIFITDFFVFTVFNAAGIFLIYLLSNGDFLVSITDNEVIYETVWGEVNSFELTKIKFFENKPLPFWVPKLAERYIKYITITWEDEEIYAISFFSKVSIHKTSVIDIISEKWRNNASRKV